MILGRLRHDRQLSAADLLLFAPLVEIHRMFFNDPSRRDYGPTLHEPSWPVRDRATTDIQAAIQGPELRTDRRWV